jgi:hypothetical protein
MTGADDGCRASFPIGEDLQCDLLAGHDGDHWDSGREILWERWSRDEEKNLQEAAG